MARKPNIYEQQQLKFYEEEKLYEPVSTEFPEISSIDIRLDFTNHEWGGNPDTVQTKFAGARRAFFKFRCPHRECVSGGFDLSSEVREAIRSRKTSAEGRIICQGWQDKERIDKYHCLLEAQYMVNISYLE